MNLPTRNLTKGKTYIILLNYCSFRDTVPCLDSLKKLQGIEQAQILLVDNASPDGSGEQIFSYLSKAMPDFAAFEKKGKTLSCTHGEDTGHNLLFFQSDENNGFSAGNNIALDYAVAQEDGAYYWFLNNDTLQDSSALSEMLFFLEKENLVMTSSILYDMEPPQRMQAIGIAKNRPIYTMPIVGHHEMLKLPKSGNICLSYEKIYEIYPDLYALPGASFLLSSEGLSLIGGRLDEIYDFYFEEAEIAECLRKENARYAPCFSSVVWHKGGASAKEKGSFFSAYHTARSRMIFVKRHDIAALPLSIFYIIAKVLFYMAKGRGGEARGLIHGLLAGLQKVL